MLIQSLYDKRRITSRAYKVCLNNHKHTIQDLHQHFNEYNTFLNLIKCTPVTNEELKELLHRYDHIPPVQEIENEQDNHQYMLMVTNLDEAKAKILELSIANETRMLSHKSQKLIRQQVSSDLSPTNVFKTLFIPKTIDVHQFKGLEEKHHTELKRYLKNLKNYVLQVEKTSFQQLNMLTKTTGSFNVFYASHNKKYPNNVAVPQSIFSRVHDALQNPNIFGQVAIDVFNSQVTIYKEPQQLTVEQIAEKNATSVSHVNSVLKKTLNRLFGRLYFIRSFTENLKQYGIDLTTKYIEVSDDSVNTINEYGRTNFTKEFIIYILYVYLSTDIELMGKPLHVLRINHQKLGRVHTWQQFHLIHRSIPLKIDIDALIFDMHKRVHIHSRHPYVLNFREYVAQFMVNPMGHHISMACAVVKVLLWKEFNMKVQNGELLFDLKKRQYLPDYVVEALHSLDRPSHITQIFKWVEKRHPGKFKSVDSIRAYCTRHTEIIHARGQSTYALKEWKTSKHNIIEGNVREVVKAILEESDQPMHIQAIMEEFHKYREYSSEHSVLTNLKDDTIKGRFIFFPSKFVGLKSKEHLYDKSKYENISSRMVQKMKKLITKGEITDKESMVEYLMQNHQLTYAEAIHVINNQSYNQS